MDIAVLVIFYTEIAFVDSLQALNAKRLGSDSFRPNSLLKLPLSIAYDFTRQLTIHRTFH